MANLRVMITMPGRSHIPEDVFVNTIHVQSGPLQVFNHAIELAQGVADAYNITHDGTVTGNPLSMYMSRFIDRENCSIRVYDLGDPKPREPVIAPWQMNAAPNTQDMPEEVALCLTLAGAPPVTSRRRGRMYIGPLGTNTIGTDFTQGGVDPSRPNNEVLSAIAGFGTYLKNAIDAIGYTWVIQSSRPTLNYVPVTHGWVDNAWDTQRRRGVDPTSRRVWPNTV